MPYRQIGSHPYEDYVYQRGAFAGLAEAMTISIDKCISLNFGKFDGDSYAWLTEENSNMFYNISQKSSWYNELSTDRKIAYDFGYIAGLISIMGEETRFPNIWEWKNP